MQESNPYCACYDVPSHQNVNTLDISREREFHVTHIGVYRSGVCNSRI